MNYEDKLKYVLSLPCVISENECILDSPLLVNSNPRYYRPLDGIFRQDIRDGEEPFQFMQRLFGNDGPWRIDCATYAQVVSCFFSELWNFNYINLYIAMSEYSARCIYDQYGEHIGILSIEDADVSNFLSDSNTSSGAQWLVKLKDGEDRYLGLTNSDGPQVYSLSIWAQLLYDGLVEYSTIQRNESISSAFKQVMHDNRVKVGEFLRQGSLDEWIFSNDVHHTPLKRVTRSNASSSQTKIQ